MIWLKRLLNPAARGASYELFGLPLPDMARPAKVEPREPVIAVLTPVKNASAHLDRFFGLIDALDYPKTKLHLILLEGDSTDDTMAQLEAWRDKIGEAYHGFDILKEDFGYQLPGHRHADEVQKKRRSILAACRNQLLAAGLEVGAEKFLFVDVDLCEIPPDAISQMLHFNAPILAANCLQETSDALFDLNIFCYARRPSDAEMEPHMHDGLYQPPKGFPRIYPNRMRHVVEQVHCVGGTFLMIDPKVVTAGVVFPEIPYRCHLETEGFSLMALDKGFGAFVLPKLIVRHVNESKDA